MNTRKRKTIRELVSHNKIRTVKPKKVRFKGINKKIKGGVGELDKFRSNLFYNIAGEDVDKYDDYINQLSSGNFDENFLRDMAQNYDINLDDKKSRDRFKKYLNGIGDKIIKEIGEQFQINEPLPFKPLDPEHEAAILGIPFQKNEPQYPEYVDVENDDDEFYDFPDEPEEEFYDPDEPGEELQDIEEDPMYGPEEQMYGPEEQMYGPEEQMYGPEEQMYGPYYDPDGEMHGPFYDPDGEMHGPFYDPDGEMHGPFYEDTEYEDPGDYYLPDFDAKFDPKMMIYKGPDRTLYPTGYDEDEEKRQTDFSKKQGRIRQYQNVIDILNNNFRKNRADRGMVNRPTEAYTSAGKRSSGYYYPEYDYSDQSRSDFYNKVRRPYNVETYTNLLNQKSYYNKLIGRGKKDDFFFLNRGGDMEDVYNQDVLKYPRDKLEKDVSNVVESIKHGENVEFIDDQGIYSTLPLFAFNSDANQVFKVLTISKDNFKVIGSASYISSPFPSDLDILEIVDSNSPQQTIQIFINGIRNIINKINEDKEIWYDHVKLGLDVRYPEDIGKLKNNKFIPNSKFLDNLAYLYKNNMLKFDEYEFMRNGEGKNQEYYEKIKKILDNYRKLRWTESDIDNGFKSLPGNKVISIDEACTQKSKINIETYASIEGEILDVSNFFVLTYTGPDKIKRGINVYDEQIEKLEKYMVDDLKKAIYHLYYSKLDYNPVKMVKRIYSLNRISGAKDPLNKKINSILSGEPGKVYFVISYLKTFIEFLQKDFKFPDESEVQVLKIKRYISKIAKLSSKYKDTLLRLCNDILRNIEKAEYEPAVRDQIINDLGNMLIILDNFLQQLIKHDSNMKAFLPPPAKYLPPKSEQEYN